MVFTEYNRLRWSRIVGSGPNIAKVLIKKHTHDTNKNLFKNYFSGVEFPNASFWTTDTMHPGRASRSITRLKCAID